MAEKALLQNGTFRSRDLGSALVLLTDRKMLALRSGRIRGVLGAIDSATREQLDRALLVVLGLVR